MRRVLKGAAFALLALVLLGAGALAWLFTPSGGRFVRARVVAAVSSSIAGSLSIDDLSLSWLGVRVRGVRLSDPKGRPAARVESLSVQLQLRPLLRRHVIIDDVTVVAPVLHTDADGTPRALQAAIAPRAPKPPKPETPPSTAPFVVQLMRFTLQRGELRPEGGALPAIEGLSVQAHARVAGAPLAAEGAVAVAADVVSRAQQIALRVALDASFAGSSLQTLDSKATVRVSGFVRAQPVSVQLAADAHAGAVTARELRVSAPGLDLTGSGRVGPDSVDAAVAARALDIERVVRAFLGDAAAAQLQLAGRGTLTIKASGPLTAPGARVQAALTGVRGAGIDVERVNVDAALSDVRKPDRGHVRLTLSNVRRAQARVSDALVSYTAPGDGGFAADVHVDKDRASLRAEGRWLVPGSALRLSRLAIGVRARPREAPLRLVLQKPATVRFGGGDVLVKDFALAGSGQAVTLDLNLHPRTVQAAARVRLDLAALTPFLALVPGLPGKLSGRVSCDVRARGALPLPALKIAARIDDVRAGRVGPLSLKLDADVKAARASGRVQAAAMGTEANVAFVLPTTWPWPARAPVAVELSLSGVDLAALPDRIAALRSVVPAVPQLCLPPLAGRVAATVALAGTADKPTLDARLALDDLTLKGQRLGTWQLTAHDKGAGLGAKLHGDGLAEIFDVAAQTQVPLSRLLHGREHVPADAPLAMEAHIERLRLPDVVRAARVFAPDLQEDVRGAVSLHAKLSGPPAQPLGTVQVGLHGVAARGLPDVDADTAVTLTETSVAVRASASSQKGTNKVALLDLRASADVPPARRLQPAAWLDAPSKIAGVLGPVRLERAPVDVDLAGLVGAGRVRAKAEAHVYVVGPLRAPKGTVDLSVRDLALGTTPLGQAHARVAYDGRSPQVDVNVNAATGGALVLRARPKAPLTVGDVLRPGFAPSRVAFDLDVAATNFSLSLISAVAPELQQVAGTLDGKAHVEGTAQAPRFAGTLHIQKAAAHLAGFGRIEDLNAAVAATDRGVALKSLSMRSGRGRVQASGEATRATGGLDLAVNAEVDNFPLVTAGRRLGEATLRARATGHVAATGMRLATTVPELRLDLEGETPKAVQPLEAPADVVFVRSGKPSAPMPILSAPKRASGTRAQGFQTVVEVDAPRNLWVRAPDATAELGLTDEFRVVVDQQGARAFGSVEVRRGQLSVFGRRFDVSRDTRASWHGALDAPVVDARLDHVNKEDVRVWITAKGPRERLVIEFNSNAGLSQSEIITLLITGRRELASKGGNQFDSRGEAASLVGGLVAAQLRKSLLRNVPIDVLQIGTNQIEAGSYLTDDLYVGYVRRFSQTTQRRFNPNAVRVEYSLSPRWGVEAEWEHGEQPTGSADLVWKLRY